MTASENSLSERTQGRTTVLLVDDEQAILAVTRILLEEAGFAVLTAATGDEALEVFGELRERIDVVLLDVTMPHLGGEALVRELRRLRADVRVVVCSGWPAREIERRFDGTGFAAFVPKPYRPTTLVTTLREVACA